MNYSLLGLIHLMRPIVDRQRRRNLKIYSFTLTCLDSTFLSFSVSRYVLWQLCAESKADTLQETLLPVTTSSSLPPPTTPSTSATASSSFSADLTLWSVVDPDVVHENPVEDKHRRLVRSHRSSPYDRELKPNAKIRDELAVCFPYT